MAFLLSVCQAHLTSARSTLEILQRPHHAWILNFEYFITALWSLPECCSLWSVKKARIYDAGPCAMPPQLLASLAYSICDALQRVTVGLLVGNFIFEYEGTLECVLEVRLERSLYEG